jgi:hypothetical protein
VEVILHAGTLFWKKQNIHVFKYINSVCQRCMIIKDMIIEKTYLFLCL